MLRSSQVNIGPQAGGWIAFGIFSILGLMYLGFAFMLVVKILEGIIRLIRGVPFSVSKHSLDSGLFGALGCCGSPTRRRKRRARRPEDAHTSRIYSDTTHSNTSPTPYRQHQANISYLKPEQASIPYRESSDDDNGFIMESWSKTDLNLSVGGMRSKSKLVPEESATDESSPSTGFARVGGGRAHFDAPYAIAKGKQPVAPGRTSSSPAPPSLNPRQEPLIIPHPTTKPPDPLPKGAAPPFHSRTRSQTAVIEDASTLSPMIGATKGGSSSRPDSAGASTGAASRPGSSGRTASHHGHSQRPGSSGKSPRRSFNSIPTAGAGTQRTPSRDMPPRQALLIPDEMGAVSQPKSALSSKGPRRRWFRLGGPSAVDSSSDDEDEDVDVDVERHSRESSGRKHGSIWGIRSRRKSESDMKPALVSPAGTFVVIRSRPHNLGQLPAAQSVGGSARGEGSHQSRGMDNMGSPISEQANVPAAAALISRTPLSPAEIHEQLRTQSPPSSYNLSRNSRRMSSSTS